MISNTLASLDTAVSSTHEITGPCLASPSFAVVWKLSLGSELGNCRAQLMCFPSLRDPSFMMSNVLKVVISCVLSGFLIVSDRSINSVLITPSEADFPGWLLKHK